MKTNGNDTVNQMTMEAFQKSGQIGLTKREHFAGLAMQGLLANFQSHGHFGNHPSYPMVSQISVECADALIAELNRTES